MSPHPAHCRACKPAVAALLTAAFGPMREQYTLGLPATLAGYRGDTSYISLAAIWATLAAYRGHGAFVRTGMLPACDFVVPTARLVVEFDEQQHFTEPRRRALAAYPATLPLGFDRARWIALSATIQAQDPEPPDRDEQRACNDTLRDFSSLRTGFHPTIRLYAGEAVWCAHSAAVPADLAWFRALIMARLAGLSQAGESSPSAPTG